MNITEILPGIHYVGVNDRTTTRFEGLWSLPQGVSYNAYLVADEKVALIDTVEEGFGSRLTENIREAIGDRKIDYLVINHMEPDHSSSVRALRMLYPDIQIVGNAKTLQMLQGFYGIDTGTLEVKEGDSISLGSKTLSFYMAPMVHWPETMVTWCAEAGTLFSGDAFGTFGAIDGGITDSQIDPSRYWDEMRRYYACIVGKYGGPVQKALAKVRGLNPTTICSTHGPVWQREIPQVMDVYDRLSRYEGEPGVVPCPQKHTDTILIQKCHLIGVRKFHAGHIVQHPILFQLCLQLIQRIQTVVRLHRCRSCCRTGCIRCRRVCLRCKGQLVTGCHRHRLAAV